MLTMLFAMSLPILPPLANGSFTAELGGHLIHYEVHGSGPVLMTVPNSWGLSLEGLRALYRPLEDSLTLVYFDPRGMGDSGPVEVPEDRSAAAVRADFQALREHLGIDEADAIGWSNGATNLIFLAKERPETIQSAIFLHGNASFDAEDARAMGERYPELFRGFARFGKEMEEEELSRAQRARRVKAFDLEVWFPVMFADPEAGRRMLPGLFEEAEFSWEHVQFSNREWLLLDLRDDLGRITARSLVISGAHDMLPPEKGQELASGIPDARFELFERSGHFAPLEEPERFRRTVVRFLSGQ